MFDAVTTARPRQGPLRDGTVTHCACCRYRQPAEQVQNSIAAFVAPARVRHQLGEAAQQRLERINAAEASSSPERQGAYSPPMPVRTAERGYWHWRLKH
jgi:hypothetical protein